MRRLTFKGFLAQYVKGLSIAGTMDLTTLAREATAENFRLRAPLLLYAVTQGKTANLRSALLENGCHDSLLNMLSVLECTNVEQALESGALPEDYLKVWTSFKVRRDRPEHEDDLKAAMRDKIIQLQKSKKCSNYRVYKDLNLNPGNINSWLKHGDGSKVSYQTAEKIVEYVIHY